MNVAEFFQRQFRTSRLVASAGVARKRGWADANAARRASIVASDCAKTKSRRCLPVHPCENQPVPSPEWAARPSSNANCGRFDFQTAYEYDASGRPIPDAIRWVGAGLQRV